MLCLVCIVGSFSQEAPSAMFEQIVNFGTTQPSENVDSFARGILVA